MDSVDSRFPFAKLCKRLASARLCDSKDRKKNLIKPLKHCRNTELIFFQAFPVIPAVLDRHLVVLQGHFTQILGIAKLVTS